MYARAIIALCFVVSACTTDSSESGSTKDAGTQGRVDSADAAASSSNAGTPAVSDTPTSPAVNGSGAPSDEDAGPAQGVSGPSEDAGFGDTGGALPSDGGGVPVADAGGGQGGAASGGDAGVARDGGAGSSAGVRLPPANAPFDYQLGGAYEPPPGVEVVSRDRNDAPASGLYNICYVNGFQAQPDEEDFWYSEHPDLLLRDDAGDPVVDPDWDEILLDTSSQGNRAQLAAIVRDWIVGCAESGFDAVEIDNLDSYGRSGGRLTQANNVAFIAQLSQIAHDAGLAIGQKNATELLSQAPAMGTDFAVAEECNRYDECQDYRDVYGDRVFVIEYRRQDFDQGCTDFPELSIVLRDLDVSRPASASYVYDGC